MSAASNTVSSTSSSTIKRLANLQQAAIFLHPVLSEWIRVPWNASMDTKF